MPMFAHGMGWLSRGLLAAAGLFLLSVGLTAQDAMSPRDTAPPSAASILQLTWTEADPAPAAGQPTVEPPTSASNANSAPNASSAPNVSSAAPGVSPPDTISSSLVGAMPTSSSPAPLSAPQAPADVPIAPPEPTSNVTPAADAALPVESSSASGPTAVAVGAAADPLKPIPDPAGNGQIAPSAEHHKVETASFNGVTPGVSTEAQTQKAWGAPRRMTSQNGRKVHLYAVDPFDQVEAIFLEGKVSSIVVRLNAAVPAPTLATQLNLASIRPVLVSNELGEILGEAFPERGVVFAFEPGEKPGQASMRVNQIVLEPVSAEPFVLRAETYLETQPETSRWDLENAVKLNPQHARAHWLQARVLAGLGDNAGAMAACDQALQLAPGDVQYQVTRAQILGQSGRFREGVAQAAAAQANAEKRPHIRARALCLQGDLIGSGPSPDYAQALQYHTQAITTADPLAASPHPAIRLAAKEVLIDAHLGAAHDIAWGNWNEKETSVAKWLERARAFADELIASDGGTEDYRFRVASRALAAYVGLQGKADPAPWTEEVLSTGQKLISSAADASRKQEIQWDLGLALYDAVQIYQMRSEHDPALRYAEQAITCMEQAASHHENLADLYLIGRLYFRLGAIHAVAQQNHRTAITWFEKAIPVFEKSAQRIAAHEAGRLGETFVSMGVSYWESGQRNRAVELSERGAALIENGVKQGALQQASLEVPYSNLATMYRQLGQTQQADRLMQQALRSKDTTIR